MARFFNLEQLDRRFGHPPEAPDAIIRDRLFEPYDAVRVSNLRRAFRAFGIGPSSQRSRIVVLHSKKLAVKFMQVFPSQSGGLPFAALCFLTVFGILAVSTSSILCSIPF